MRNEVIRTHMFVSMGIVNMFHQKVQSLEEKADLLETEANKREQYTRRPNLRFSGIAEAVQKHK